MKKEEVKKKLSGDLGLKIFSAVIAICLWFYVVQVQDPDISRTIKNVPVVFTQTNLLEAKNLILLNGEEYTVDVEIRGPRKNVMGVNKKNLNVLVDVGSIEKTGQHTLVTKIVLPYANIEVVGKNPSTLQVTADSLITVTKPVEIVEVGTPKDTYEPGKKSATPEEISIKGPKTIVDGIQRVAVNVDVSEKTADITGKQSIVVYGAGDQEIKSPMLSFSEEEIAVHIEILKSKTVDLELIFAESAKHFEKEYVLDKNSIKSVQIAGVQSMIENMDKVKTKEITRQDINEHGEVTVTLDLPEGVRSLGSETFTLRFARRTQSDE